MSISVPKSVTLDDRKRRNGRVFCVISPNSVALWAYYVKVVVDTRIDGYIQGVKCSPKNLVFRDISLMAIFAGNHLQRGHLIEVTPLSLAKIWHIISHNLETVQARR